MLSSFMNRVYMYLNPKIIVGGFLEPNLNNIGLKHYPLDEGGHRKINFTILSHYALIKLAQFYGVTADYLLGLSEMKRHPNTVLQTCV